MSKKLTAKQLLKQLQYEKYDEKGLGFVVDGKTVTHYRLITNGEHCFDVYAAAGLLPQSVAALREYHEVLAGEQAAMQATVPAGMQSACELADYVFLPARYLAHGFPVRQVSRAGVTRQLMDFKTAVPVEPKLFETSWEEGVGYVTGSSFFDDGSGENFIRLCYSNVSEAEIGEGIMRLGRALERAQA